MDINDYLIETRRYFHRNPELSFKEYKTAGKIEEELKSMGLRPERITETGIIADIINDKNKKTVAIRADIDALPVTEENDVDYRSLNDGIMHACGHDTHITMLLGAAKMIINDLKNFNGNVRLIFQPAEESPPGGAIEMIKNGALENVDYIIGQHIWGSLDAGKIGIYYHEMMANADQFNIKIHGKGGHGSAPHEAIDTIYISSHLINMLNNIISREIDPQEPAVLTVGKINAGYRYNVIAAHSELSGTVRTFSRDVQEKIKKRIGEILEGLKMIYNINYEYDYEYGYPVLVNNENISKIIEETASSILGNENIVHPKPNMGGEDFAYYLEKVPGAYYVLGGAFPGKHIGNHSPLFNIDESVLYNGALILKESARNILLKNP
ncbi:M20 metallopeptidase family protein [Picrophilus oshimae]|uniref:Amidohydrolase n=1 Tax=Picrophilus torridus (strain ATCC 700027 / DSM 9790 / JCM 10055 / NBRC 100828 / KAW 2/3) TaxID=1122961 RepID=Q6L0Z5_PICTO|nr:amidohydrolase [Picrophilus oshimae]AAT43357.1 N-acyl-L-amino acid amidohydrolase [Picrophilus oshimae DSM 9789]SMD30334.1 amidohydrolase [Picrophilus oshimae DSM 9789]